MYLALVRDEMASADVRVLSYCLMTNHVHLLVVPGRADSLAVLFRRVHGRAFYNSNFSSWCAEKCKTKCCKSLIPR